MGKTPEQLIIAKRRAEIKAAAKKTKDGSLMYRVGPAGYYSQGRRYYEGEVVYLPPDVEPSVTFEPVKEEGVAPVQTKPATIDNGKRPSDRDVA